jgi:hypothetical protein
MPNHIGDHPRYLPNDRNEYDCQCARCGSSCDWTDCWNCGGEGVDGHDCGEDCCCCAYPEENVRCSICKGYGGWYSCLSSAEWCKLNPLPREGREPYDRGEIEWFETRITAEH